MKTVKLHSLIGFLVIFSFGIQFTVYAQGGFAFPEGKKRDRIPFDLVNNLAVIPIEINGKKLSFLLDTGVNNTLLFSLNQADSLEIKNVTPVKIRGLGDGGDIEALKSLNNEVRVGAAVDKNHEVYVIFDQDINFSPRMGVPIHGVIGYDFYKDFVVKTDYDSELLTIYDPEQYKPKRCSGCETFDIILARNKPYIKNRIKAFDQDHEVTLLIDSGASDALWLFDEDYGISDTPKNYFMDFLGLGLSGGVYGKRSKVEEVSLGSFSFKNVNVAYPDSLALKNLRTRGARNGTLGSDILKRFTVIMDYPSRKITLKKNAFYKKPFHYNMSGIVIEHSGMVPVKAVRSNNAESIRINQNNGTSAAVNIDVNPLFTFFLTPKFVVAELREGSPADLAGVLVGDEVLVINGKPFYQWKLAEVNSLFSSKSGRKIVLQISRNGMKVKKRFTLKEVL
ncbi:MAG: aspartyl protease family protein [Bacteroidota bacterium]